MRLYHGTQNGNLTELRADFKSGRKDDPGVIFLTDSYACAFLYASSVLRCFAVKKDGTLCFVEKAPNAFEKMYKGHGCFIFSVEVENPKKIEHITGHVYVCDHNIKLDKKKCEHIPDCYEKLLELERSGAICLQRWENYTDEQKERVKENFIKTIAPTMKENKLNFPETYKILVELYPELEVKNEMLAGEKT